MATSGIYYAPIPDNYGGFHFDNIVAVQTNSLVASLLTPSGDKFVWSKVRDIVRKKLLFASIELGKWGGLL